MELTKKEKIELFNLGFKYCPKCETQKNIAEFANHKKSWDRLQAICKSCHYKINKKYDDAHREERIARKRKYSDSEKGKIADKKYRSTEKYKIHKREYDRIYRLKNTRLSMG